MGDSMNPSGDSRRGIELRFILIYFWTYWMQCIHGTFLNLSLRLRHFSGTDIGLLGAVSALTGVFVTPLVGVRFDMSNNRPRFLTGLTLLCTVAFLAFRFMPSVHYLIPVAVLLAVGWQSLVPLLDSMTLSRAITGAAKHGYGGYRRWGAVGFAVAGVAVGAMVSWRGIGWIFPSYATCALVVAALVWRIPPGISRPGDRTLGTSDILDLLRLPNFRRFLIYTLIGSIGSSGCFAFRSIHLDAIGVPGFAIGLLWVLPIAAEVLCFTAAQSLLRRWGTGPLILAGRLTGAARWWLLSVVPYSPWLFLTETLHGPSFSLFYPAALKFVHSEVPSRLRGTAQVLFFTSTMGLGSSIGAFVAGRLYDLAGMRPVLWIGGAVLAVAGILQVALVKHISAEEIRRGEAGASAPATGECART